MSVIEFDLVIGKNDVSKTLDSIKESAKNTQSSINSMLLGISEVKKETSNLDKNKSIDKTSMSFGKLTSVAFGVVGGITAAGYALKEFFGSAIEAEESVSRLEISLKQTGIFTQKVSEDFKKLASSIQETSVYTDSQVLSTMGLLQTIGQFTKEGLEKATKATIELASAMRIDLETAASLVGKAANGNSESLKKYGINVRKGSDDTETFANVLKELSRLNGSTEAEINTLGGAFVYLANQISGTVELFSKAVAGASNLKYAVVGIGKEIRDFRKSIEEKSAKENTIDALIFSVRALSKEFNVAYSVYEKFFKKLSSKEQNTQRLNTEDFLAGNKSLDAILNPEINNTIPKKYALMIGDIAKEVKNETGNLLLPTEERRKKARLSAIDSELELLKSISKGIKEEEDSLVKLKSILPKSETETIQQEYDSRIKMVKELADKGTIYQEEAAAYLYDIEKDYADKLNEYKKKQEEKRIADLQPLIQQSSMVATSVLGGREGARSLLQGGASAVGSMFGGPAGGQAASQIVGLLSQGGDANREMIKQFSEAVPEFTRNIVESIPVIIDEVVKQTPKIVDGLVKQFSDPKLWEGMVKNLSRAAVNLATMQVKAFMNYIPKFFSDFGKNLISAIVDGFKKAVGSVGDAVGGFVESIPVVGSLYSGVKNILGFAQGGQVKQVPSGFPSDSFPARLTSSELVVDRDTTRKLTDFLDSNSGNDTSITDAILIKILDKLSEPINVSTSANVNGKAFADIILQLNRNNARLTV